MGDIKAYYGVHPRAHAAAFASLKLPPTMRNSQFPGGDTDAYAPLKPAQVCAMPLAYTAFTWTRPPPNKLVIQETNNNSTRAFVLTPELSAYLAAAKSFVKPYKLLADGRSYAELPAQDVTQTAVSWAAPTTCAVGVEVAPWSPATGTSTLTPPLAVRR